MQQFVCNNCILFFSLTSLSFFRSLIHFLSPLLPQFHILFLFFYSLSRFFFLPANLFFLSHHLKRFPHVYWQWPGYNDDTQSCHPLWCLSEVSFHFFTSCLRLTRYCPVLVFLFFYVVLLSKLVVRDFSKLSLWSSPHQSSVLRYSNFHCTIRPSTTPCLCVISY